MTPGACKSDFDREFSGVGRIMSSFMSAIIVRTAEAGSRTLVAAVAAGEESQGSYMADCRVTEYVTPVFIFRAFN
jgi:retinol dehydrogenase-12